MISFAGSRSSETKIYNIISNNEMPISNVKVDKMPNGGCNLGAYTGGYTNGLAYGGVSAVNLCMCGDEEITLDSNTIETLELS